jgi:hypothetical protein
MVSFAQCLYFCFTACDPWRHGAGMAGGFPLDGSLRLARQIGTARIKALFDLECYEAFL